MISLALTGDLKVTTHLETGTEWIQEAGKVGLLESFLLTNQMFVFDESCLEIGLLSVIFDYLQGLGDLDELISSVTISFSLGNSSSSEGRSSARLSSGE